MSKLFVLAGIKYFQIIDGSFFVPYASCLKNLSKVVLLVCNGMLSRIYRCSSVITAVTALLPESECKGSTIFYTNKLFPLIFSKNRKKISFSAKNVAFITIIAQLY